MPRKPLDFTAAHDPRLDPFMNRAAVVSNGDEHISTMFVEISSLVTKISGHLWWAQWGEAREFVILHERMADGFLTDHWIEDDHLDEQLEAWERNTFWDMGELRDVRWLDEAESFTVAREFGVESTHDTR